MKKAREYYVYIMACKTKRLYVGVTNDIERRVFEHKNKLVDGFTAKYNMIQLVYYEETDDICEAIQREKTLKKWLRKWKIELIEKDNPNWEDLAADW
jgi:putative endonuclease